MSTRATRCMVATGLALTLAVSCRAPEESALSQEPVSRLVQLAGRGVHYLDAGRGGHAIVLVHGWASDHRVWADHVRPLAEGRRVLVLDLPGHGRSEEPARPYSMDLFAEAIAAVLDDAGVERAVLVGHSNGVPCVRQFYRRHPRRTAGLVLVDGPLALMVEEEMAERFLAAFRSEGWQASVAGFVDSMPPLNLPPEQVASIREMAVSQPQHVIVGGLEAALDQGIWGEDPIEAPTLVLLSAQPSWDAAYEAHVRRLIPEVDYRTWTGVSHFLMMDRPEEFNETVAKFVDGVGW